MEQSDSDVVVAFNEHINRRDLVGLVQLMTRDHRFVDSAGHTVEGREACRDAWASFFDSFPDYRNVFVTVTVVAPGRVAADGYSVCTVAALDGPARWQVVVRSGLVAEWRVTGAGGSRSPGADPTTRHDGRTRALPFVDGLSRSTSDRFVAFAGGWA